MKTQLITALETICPNNVFLQGTLNPNESYPNEFITLWVNSTDDTNHFDDDVETVEWNYSVVFYSNNPDRVASVPSTIRTTLKNAGFIPKGKGFDIPSDVQTHTGWAMEFSYLETI